MIFSMLPSSAAITLFSIPKPLQLHYAYAACSHRSPSTHLHSGPHLRIRSRRVCCQTTDDEALRRLKSWMTVCGAELSAFDVGIGKEGLRGVLATETTDPNLQVALRVPVALALSDDPEEFRETPFGQAVPASEWLRIPLDMRLSLRLLAEKAKGTESCWKDFISLLPAEYTSARHLSDACLRQAGSPFVTEQAERCRAFLIDMHTELSQLGSEFGAPVPSLDELGWALDAVHTRSFTVDAGQERGVRRYLIPFVDMLNHDEDRGCGFAYNEDNECFEVRRFEGGPLHAGDQIFLDYGAKSSEEMQKTAAQRVISGSEFYLAREELRRIVSSILSCGRNEYWLAAPCPQVFDTCLGRRLVMYGFVPSTVGGADAIALSGAYTAEDLAAAPGEAEFRREKAELLDLFRYSAPRSFQIAPWKRNFGQSHSKAFAKVDLKDAACLPLRRRRNVDPAIVCALRLALLTPGELEAECEGSWYRAVVHAPVSDDNEQRVAQALRRRLQDALQADESSIEDDEALLSAEMNELDDLTRCAVQLRLNRKRMLAELISVVDSFSGKPKGSNLLDALDYYFKEHLFAYLEE